MITLEGLTRYYGLNLAVANIDLTINKGEILGLLGPNGAGKSTTLRMLTGYLTPTAGKILIKGVDAAEEPETVKSFIGYLPESTPLYQDMLVHDYLMLMADIRKIDPSRKKARIKELSVLCDLTDVMHKSIGTLSKGYRQRVGLAYALLSDPEILVLDEPTSGLDPNQIVEIRSIIRDIGKSKTVILSTHILSEAEATCDRIVIINKGKIVADGTSEDLKKNMGETRTVRMTLKGGTKEAYVKTFSSLKDVSSVKTEKDPEEKGGTQVAVVSNEDVREEVYGALKKTDWILLKMDQEKRSLESIFRTLTQEGQK